MNISGIKKQHTLPTNIGIALSNNYNQPYVNKEGKLDCVSVNVDILNSLLKDREEEFYLYNEINSKLVDILKEVPKVLYTSVMGDNIWKYIYTGYSLLYPIYQSDLATLNLCITSAGNMCINIIDENRNSHVLRDLNFVVEVEPFFFALCYSKDAASAINIQVPKSCIDKLNITTAALQSIKQGIIYNNFQHETCTLGFLTPKIPEYFFVFPVNDTKTTDSTWSVWETQGKLIYEYILMKLQLLTINNALTIDARSIVNNASTVD